MSSLQCWTLRSISHDVTTQRKTTYASFFINIPSKIIVFLFCVLLLLHPTRINVNSLPLYRDSERQTTSLHHDNKQSQLHEEDASNSVSLDHIRHSNKERTVEEEEGAGISKRAVVINPEGQPFETVSYWEDGIIPYQFKGEIRDERLIKNRILNAMATWHRKTCVTFVPKKDTDEYYINIELSQQVCNSQVGKRLGYRNGQSVKITKECSKHKGRLLHEFGHVIGFFHEHQRRDRDQYIRVNMNNIIPSLRKEFEIRDDSHSLGTEYDYKSVMHYDPRSTAIDPSQPSFVVLDESVDISDIGQRNVLSKLDKLQANLLYECATPDRIPLRRDEVITTSNFIEHGDQLSFQPLLNNSQCQWMSCSSQGCSLSSCPRKFLRPNDRKKCPDIIFRIHKIAANSSNNTSPYIAVGDYVSLHKNGNLDAFGCSETPGNCSFSISDCISDSGDFNSRECCEQLMIVRSIEKSEGERIQHKDKIWFEFLKTPSRLPDQMSWLICDNGDDVYNNGDSSCYRVIERVNNNESILQLGGSGGDLSVTPPSLFSIYKF